MVHGPPASILVAITAPPRFRKREKTCLRHRCKHEALRGRKGPFGPEGLFTFCILRGFSCASREVMETARFRWHSLDDGQRQSWAVEAKSAWAKKQDDQRQLLELNQEKEPKGAATGWSLKHENTPSMAVVSWIALASFSVTRPQLPRNFDLFTIAQPAEALFDVGGHAEAEVS